MRCGEGAARSRRRRDATASEAGQSPWPTSSRRRSLGEQEIEEESLLRRRLRCRGRRCRRCRGARTFTSRWRCRTIVFIAQRGTRRVRRGRRESGGRRRVETALAPACCKPERRCHGDRQAKPPPSIDGFFHLHPITPIDPLSFAPANGREGSRVSANHAHHTRSASRREPCLH